VSLASFWNRIITSRPKLTTTSKCVCGHARLNHMDIDSNTDDIIMTTCSHSNCKCEAFRSST
jgi:hypothetical protein